MKETLQTQIFKGQNKTFTSQGHHTCGSQWVKVNWPHWNTFSLKILCLQAQAVGKGVYAITSHWFMGDRGKMGRGWKLSCLETVQDLVPEETQVNRFTPQNMMDLRQLCGDECGQRNTGNTGRSNLSKIIGFNLRLKTHKTMKNSHHCNTEASWWTCLWSSCRWHIQNSKSTAAERTFNSLNSGELMTTVLLEQMPLMLSWVLSGYSDVIVSNAPKCALQR